MRVVDPGHIYELNQLESSETITLRFIKRSGRYVRHEKEWPGLQSQEVLRALIDRTKYLNDLVPCVESQDALYHLRMALFNYEARAYRRKQQQHNRQDSQHDDSERPRPWRDRDLDDVPFNEYEIENRPVGDDGHILIEEET